MSSQAVTAFVMEMIARAEAGVDYSPRTGALCPACGKKTKIYKSMPWEGAMRIRYHYCLENGCILASMKKTVKSVEVER